MLDPFTASPFLILGIPPFAEPDIIVERWKTLVKSVHPDKADAEDNEISTKRTQVLNRAKERALAMTNSPSGETTKKYFFSLNKTDRRRVLDECEGMGVIYEAIWVEERWAGRQRAKNIKIENERIEKVRAENNEREKERINLIQYQADHIEAIRAENNATEKKRMETLRAENDEKEKERIDIIQYQADHIEAIRAEDDATEKMRMEKVRADNIRKEYARIEAERTNNDRIEAERMEQVRADNIRQEYARIEAERTDNDRIEAERIKTHSDENDRIEAERMEKVRADNDRWEADSVEINLQSTKSAKAPKKRKYVSSAGESRKHRKTWTSENHEFTKNKIHSFVTMKLTLNPKSFTPSKDLLKAFTESNPDDNSDPNFFFRSLQKCLDDLATDAKFTTCSRKGVRGYKGFHIQMD